ncbi:AAA family ATPase [Sandarakinorhabdus rubra]|uniref:AAA family ATPase n=1 Tax=Sandarakinorhabdus rubra TaxID=2672568 RepID=UPI0013DCDAE2|nr:AAA family ATPase [Sandarakinorhabdus rubra]
MAMLARLTALAGRTTAPDAADEAGVSALRVTMILAADTAAQADVERMNIAGCSIRAFRGPLDAFIANAPMVRRTDMLVIEIDPDDAPALAALEEFAAGPGARMAVVAAARDLTISATRRLLRSSIADVLPVPFSLEELGQAVESARAGLARRMTGDSGRGRLGSIIAFHGALGGVGTSMIAAQAALHWAETKQVLVIDLDVQRGTTALYLNLKPRLTLNDLIDADDRLDVEFLKMVAERHQSGLSVVASPNDMTGLDAVTPEFIDRLLDLAAQNYDLVVLDMPGVWMDWTALAMQKADLIGLVTQLSVSGVQQARRQLDVLEANGLGDRVRLVMNRMTAGLFGKYDTDEAASVMRAPVHFCLANDFPAISAALDEGVSVSKVKMKSRIEKELRQMTTAMADDIAAAASVGASA